MIKYLLYCAILACKLLSLKLEDCTQLTNLDENGSKSEIVRLLVQETNPNQIRKWPFWSYKARDQSSETQGVLVGSSIDLRYGVDHYLSYYFDLAQRHPNEVIQPIECYFYESDGLVAYYIETEDSSGLNVTRKLVFRSQLENIGVISNTVTIDEKILDNMTQIINFAKTNSIFELSSALYTNFRHATSKNNAIKFIPSFPETYGYKARKEELAKKVSAQKTGNTGVQSEECVILYSTGVLLDSMIFGQDETWLGSSKYINPTNEGGDVADKRRKFIAARHSITDITYTATEEDTEIVSKLGSDLKDLLTKFLRNMVSSNCENRKRAASKFNLEVKNEIMSGVRNERVADSHLSYIMPDEELVVPVANTKNKSKISRSKINALLSRFTRYKQKISGSPSKNEESKAKLADINSVEELEGLI